MNYSAEISSNTTRDITRLVNQARGLTIIYSFIIVVGLMANSLIIIATLKSKKLRERPQIILLNLIVCDVTNTIISAPYYLYASTTSPYVPSKTPTVVRICQAYLYLSYSLGFVSILALVIISIDRYVAVIRPYFYQMHVTNNVVGVGILMSWLIPFCLTIPGPVMDGWMDYDGIPGNFCGVQWAVTSKVFIVVVVIFCFILPTVVIFVTNIRVYRTAKQKKYQLQATRQSVTSHCQIKTKTTPSKDKSIAYQPSLIQTSTAVVMRNDIEQCEADKQLPSSKRKSSVSNMDIQIAVSTLFLVVCFLLSWLPFVIPRILVVMHIQISETLTNYGPAFAFSNVAWDPLLILWCRKEIRRGVFALFWRTNRITACNEIIERGQRTVVESDTY